MSDPGGDPELEIEIPPKPGYVRTVRLAVAALARMHEVPEEMVEDIKLAVSEASTNAIGLNAGAGGAPVAVQMWASPASVVVDVLDRGPEPAHEVLGAPEDIDTGDLPFEKALSLPLIRGLVDEVAVTPREDGGARVRMVLSVAEQG